jgi:hypothetical protein
MYREMFTDPEAASYASGPTVAHGKNTTPLKAIS